MKRALSALLLALSLGLTATACGEDQSGDSFTDNQTDEVPGSDASRAPS